jgi:hypothetical protein
MASAASKNVYKEKAPFYYAPLPAQIVMWLEDAGLVSVLDNPDTIPTMGEIWGTHSLGRPFGLSDSAIYLVAFGCLIYALMAQFLL